MLAESDGASFVIIVAFLSSDVIGWCSRRATALNSRHLPPHQASAAAAWRTAASFGVQRVRG